MAPNLLFYQLLFVALVLICLIIHVGLPDDSSRRPKTLLEPQPCRRRRAKDLKPFAGLLHQPLCEACEQEADTRPQAPGSPPPVITFTRGRRRTVDTHAHFCPDQDCSYYGRLGRGNLRANGHPGGKPWRQFQCVSCHGYFSETHGTLFQGKHAAPDLIVWVIACLAEGLGIRGTARVFGIDAKRCCSGWRRLPNSSTPFQATFCASCRSMRCNSMSSMRCSVRSEVVTGVNPKRWSNSRVRRIGSGRRLILRRNCCCASEWASKRSPPQAAGLSRQNLFK
jgi:hypothetical protein